MEAVPSLYVYNQEAFPHPDDTHLASPYFVSNITLARFRRRSLRTEYIAWIDEAGLLRH